MAQLTFYFHQENFYVGGYGSPPQLLAARPRVKRGEVVPALARKRTTRVRGVPPLGDAIWSYHGDADIPPLGDAAAMLGARSYHGDAVYVDGVNPAPSSLAAPDGQLRATNPYCPSRE